MIISVINWAVENWQKWGNLSSVWSSWIDNYTLTNGSWLIIQKAEIKPSESAKTMTTTTQSITGSTAGIAGVFSFANTSSLSSLWSMVNQIQIFLRYMV